MRERVNKHFWGRFIYSQMSLPSLEILLCILVVQVHFSYKTLAADQHSLLTSCILKKIRNDNIHKSIAFKSDDTENNYRVAELNIQNVNF